jgi:signal transduction histidine kinase
LPNFDGLSALRIVREQSPDLPFIIVSGTLGDEKAVEVLKLGATDYVLKDRLSRLAPAILRALKDVESQKAQRRDQEQLERALRLDSLGRVAATIAHEMNNVLMSIQAAAARLPVTTDPATLLRIDEQIDLAIRRGQRITGEVARFTTPSEPVTEVVNVGAWLKRFSGDIRGIAGSNIELALEVSREDLIAHADLTQLEQVLTNLVTNARDAMPSGGGIAISAVDASGAGSNYIEIAVTDTGSGMTPDVMVHIFEPLFTTKRTGTGLGLAVSYQMVIAQGGQMFVESQPGLGTIFRVLVPRAPIRVA